MDDSQKKWFETEPEQQPLASRTITPNEMTEFTTALNLEPGSFVPANPMGSDEVPAFAGSSDYQAQLMHAVMHGNNLQQETNLLQRENNDLQRENNRLQQEIRELQHTSISIIEAQSALFRTHLGAKIPVYDGTDVLYQTDPLNPYHPHYDHALHSGIERFGDQLGQVLEDSNVHPSDGQQLQVGTLAFEPMVCCSVQDVTESVAGTQDASEEPIIVPVIEDPEDAMQDDVIETAHVSKKAKHVPKKVKQSGTKINKSPEVSKKVNKSPEASKKVNKSPEASKKVNKSPEVSKKVNKSPEVSKKAKKSPDVSKKPKPDVKPSKVMKKKAIENKEDSVEPNQDTDEQPEQEAEQEEAEQEAEQEEPEQDEQGQEEQEVEEEDQDEQDDDVPAVSLKRKASEIEDNEGIMCGSVRFTDILLAFTQMQEEGKLVYSAGSTIKVKSLTKPLQAFLGGLRQPPVALTKLADYLKIFIDHIVAQPDYLDELGAEVDNPCRKVMVIGKARKEYKLVNYELA